MYGLVVALNPVIAPPGTNAVLARREETQPHWRLPRVVGPGTDTASIDLAPPMSFLVIERLGGLVLICAGVSYLAFSTRGPAVETVLRRTWILRGASRVLVGSAALIYSAGWDVAALVTGAASVGCLLCSQWFGLRASSWLGRRRA